LNSIQLIAGGCFMMKASFWAALLLGELAACTAPAWAQSTLTAARVETAPDLKKGGADAAWAKTQPLTIGLNGGAHFNNGSTVASIKAVYTGDMFYMLVQYDDPTQSVRRFPYQKQPDGSWKKLVDPNDKGGDDNLPLCGLTLAGA
jgi:hypothetical protein